MSRSSLTLPRLTLALSPLLALGACDFQGYEPADLHYGLSENTERNTVEKLATLDADWGAGSGEAAGAQILGVLEGLFGTPSAPRFAMTDQMEFDPNFSGDEELTDEEWERVVEENRTRRFKRQLSVLASGRYAEVPEPSHARDLWKRWTEDHLPGLLEDPQALVPDGDEGEITRHDAALALFENHYPTLRESSELYRIQCLHCHGASGGGDGPTAAFLLPRPRDYRYGVFKWVPVNRNLPPRREDLMHILEAGVTFTAMPSFARFSDAELHGLIDYVRLLAIRGQVEWRLALETADGDYGSLPQELVTETYDDVWSNWFSADDGYVYYDGEVPRPDEMTDERLHHGRALFRGNVANCYTCHGVFARGDGDAIYEYEPDRDADGNEILEEAPVTFSTMEVLPDFDHVVVFGEPGAPAGPVALVIPMGGIDGHGDKDTITGTLSHADIAELLAGGRVEVDEYKVELENGWKVHLLRPSNAPVVREATKMDKVVLYDEWGDANRPRNIQQTIFRGGGRPIDLFRRVKYGIGGTKMPAADTNSLSDDDLWDIVYYVLSISEKYDIARVTEKRLASGGSGDGHGDEGHDEGGYGDDGHDEEGGQ